MKVSLTALFNNLSQFLEELKQDATAGMVDRGIVRVTTVPKMHFLIPIKTLYLVATYALTTGHLVRLERPLGEMRSNEMDESMVRLLTDSQDMIDLKCKQLDLDLRLGTLQAEILEPVAAEV